MTDRPRPSRLPDLLLGLYLAAAVLGLGWPGHALFAARVEPFVLGLPFSFAWYVAWILATCLALALYHASRTRRS